jgi:hypothetical protein
MILAELTDEVRSGSGIGCSTAWQALKPHTAREARHPLDETTEFGRPSHSRRKLRACFDSNFTIISPMRRPTRRPGDFSGLTKSSVPN